MVIVYYNRMIEKFYENEQQLFGFIEPN